MQQPPNILLITSDQQHYDTLGVTNSKIKTPNLDRLCREGTRFDRAYCPNPTCTPTRASLLTGLFPSRHGAWSLGTKLDESLITVGDVFQAHDYRTMLIGKAHFQPLASDEEQSSIESYPIMRELDYWQNFHGPWYGFDHIEITRNHADEAHVGQHYALWMEEKGLSNWRDYFVKYPPVKGEPKRELSWDLPEEFHYTPWTGERTCANIEAAHAQKRPFFCWASFHDPHPAYLVPEPWASMYDPADMEPGTLEAGEMEKLPPHFQATQRPHDQDFWGQYNESGFCNHGFHSHLHDREHLKKRMAVYYGMVSFMDQQIGRILDKLDELGLTENTLVVFTTDHGHFLGQHGLIAKGAFHYEDVLRVPMIARWPDRIPADRVSDSLQNLVDLPGTFLEAAGIEMPRDWQSVNQLPAWLGEQERVRQDTVVEFRHQPTKLHMRTYITDRYKLTVYRDQRYGELFDLHADPQERSNLWDDAESATLKAELMHKALHAEMHREPMRYPRISHA